MGYLGLGSLESDGRRKGRDGVTQQLQAVVVSHSFQSGASES